VWSGHEECDDANEVSTDGCAACVSAGRAFITSTTYNGNLGGQSGAAAKCQSRANSAGLGGTWDAWIGTNVNGPATRFVPAALGYVRVDGVLIANDFADLTNGSLDQTLSISEYGDSLSGYEVWTGSSWSGVATSATCTNWTSSSAGVTGEYGLSNSISSTWSDAGSPAACNVTRRLYCFEQ
jgi:cysteine-rich repeat protein